jgi:hypothetical protein
MLLFFLLFNDPISSQSRFKISGGFGWPDLSNLKIKYGKNIQIATSQSFFIASMYPDYKNKIHMWATAAEIYYHYGGESKFIDQHLWYVLGGLGCIWGRDGDENGVYFYLRFGRTIDFSKRTGINLNAGAFIPFFSFFDIPILPSGSISFFVRL